MNEVLVLALLVAGEYVMLKRCMEVLKRIVTMYVVKERELYCKNCCNNSCDEYNSKTCTIKGTEERYTIFWEKNRIKLAIGLILIYFYSTFIICYPILNCNNVYVEEVWEWVMAVVATLVVALSIVHLALKCIAIVRENKKLQAVSEFLQLSGEVFLVLYEPIVIVIITAVIESLSINFVNELLPAIVICANMLTIMDICNVFEKLIENICVKMESKLE